MGACRSIAQGCSEYNITVLIDGKDSVRALRAVHSRFYLATLPLAVGIVGPGAIGGTFMRQLQQQKEVGSLPPPFSLACGCCCPLITHAVWSQYQPAATAKRGGLLAFVYMTAVPPRFLMYG